MQAYIFLQSGSCLSYWLGVVIELQLCCEMDQSYADIKVRTSAEQWSTQWSLS